MKIKTQETINSGIAAAGPAIEKARAAAVPYYVSAVEKGTPIWEKTCKSYNLYFIWVVHEYIYIYLLGEVTQTAFTKTVEYAETMKPAAEKAIENIKPVAEKVYNIINSNYILLESIISISMYLLNR